MVTLNTQVMGKQTTIPHYNSVEFKYLIDVPRCDCIFGSARERSTGKALLYLIFNHRGKIYRRNGLKGTWIELNNDEEYTAIREGLLKAISDKAVPCYTTAKECIG